MEGYSVEWLGVLVAVVAQFALGFLWYSPALFQRRWLAGLGRSTDDMQSSDPTPFIVVGISALVSAVFASAVLDWSGGSDPADGLVVGVYLGVVVALAVASGHLFEQRDRGLLWINAGQEFVRLALVGLVVGLFQ